MSQEPPPSDKDSKALTAPSSSEDDSEETVGALLEHVPPHLIEKTLEKTLIGIIRDGASPRIDPETYKLAAQTTQQEQDNKLTFLMRKLDVEDSQNERQHKLEIEKHNLEVEQSRSSRKMCWPLLLAAIGLVVFAIVSGIHYAANGRETLGASILSGTVTAVFAYIGGLGTPRFWKPTK
jgi:lipopolysaccharide export LptBFGC system permease protein LptF